jgi:hypothetical protein
MDDFYLEDITDFYYTGNDATNHIYFISSTASIGSNNLQRVKIGISKNPLRRLTTLQVGSPDTLTLLYSFVVKDTDALALEERLHNKFGQLRERGEWFTMHHSIEKFIATHKETIAKYHIIVDKNYSFTIKHFCCSQLKEYVAEKRIIRLSAYENGGTPLSIEVIGYATAVGMPGTAMYSEEMFIKFCPFCGVEIICALWQE